MPCWPRTSPGAYGAPEPQAIGVLHVMGLLVLKFFYKTSLASLIFRQRRRKGGICNLFSMIMAYFITKNENCKIETSSFSVKAIHIVRLQKLCIELNHRLSLPQHLIKLSDSSYKSSNKAIS